jgi:AAA15 family ATPase/GTPase
MIEKLFVSNFKSVKELNIAPRRINFFIGEPNTGKSNILESLAFFSFGGYAEYPGKIKQFVRAEDASNIFFDFNIENKVQMSTDRMDLEVYFDHKINIFSALWREKNLQVAKEVKFTYNLSGDTFPPSDFLKEFKYFVFDPRAAFEEGSADSLRPPHGSNLMTLLLTRKSLQDSVKELFTPFGLRLGFRPQEKKIEVIKQYDDVFLTFPYALVSDTLRRTVFYLTAVYSCEDCVVMLEEPESHAFPYYTKHLGESIALDKNRNQYFLTTHNPYFLLSILEKAPQHDVAVFVTYWRDDQTRVALLSDDEVGQLMDRDVDLFFNLDRYVEE